MKLTKISSLGISDEQFATQILFRDVYGLTIYSHGKKCFSGPGGCRDLCKTLRMTAQCLVLTRGVKFTERLPPPWLVAAGHVDR